MISQALNVTFYNNYYSFVTKLLNISFLVKNIIENSIFKKKLGYISTQNNIAMSIFPNIWYIKAGYLLNNKVLSRYIKFAYGN